MAGHAELRVDGGVQLVDIVELEEDVRRGRVPMAATLHYPPWTGELWRRIDTIAALADAVDSPEARFSARLSQPPPARGTAALVALLAVAAAFQLRAGAWLAADGGTQLWRLSLGWEPTLLDGAWWGPYTAPLLHQSLVHLLGNLAILTYSAWRVERALGGAGLFGVLAGALLGATLGIAGFSAEPCVGSSLLTFGAWGGQFAIGWRHGAVVPEGVRRYYGGATVIVALPLLAWTALSPTVSFAGHLGGFLGGVAAVWLMPSVTTATRADRQATRRRAWSVAAALICAPAGVSLLGGQFPGLLVLPSVDVVDAESGMTLSLPWRYAPMPGGARLDLRVPGRGAAPLHAVVGLSNAVERHEIVPIRAQSTHEGATLTVGWDDAGLAPARARVYAWIATTARWTPPPAMEALAEKYHKHPTDPVAGFAYARGLEAVASPDQAVAVYASLDEAPLAWSLPAARARMRLCAEAPTRSGCDAAWRDTWLRRTRPDEHELWRDGVRWSSETGCDGVGGRVVQMEVAGGFTPAELALARGDCGP